MSYEVNNLALPLHQSLLESIRGSDVILQKIRVFVQRHPSYTNCTSSQSHACKSPFSRHPEPRSCTPWPDSCAALCPSLCVSGLLRKLPRRTRCLIQPFIELRRRGNQTSYEIPTRSAAIPVCLQRNLKVCRTAWDPLSSTDC